MTARTIKAQWKLFAQLVLPPNASAIQVQEMRRAFYAGAHVLLCEMVSTIGHPDSPDELGMATLDVWTKECEAFAAAEHHEREAAEPRRQVVVVIQVVIVPVEIAHATPALMLLVQGN